MSFVRLYTSLGFGSVFGSGIACLHYKKKMEQQDQQWKKRLELEKGKVEINAVKELTGLTDRDFQNAGFHMAMKVARTVTGNQVWTAYDPLVKKMAAEFTSDLLMAFYSSPCRFMRNGHTAQLAYDDKSYGALKRTIQGVTLPRPLPMNLMVSLTPQQAQVNAFSMKTLHNGSAYQDHIALDRIKPSER